MLYSGYRLQRASKKQEEVFLFSKDSGGSTRLSPDLEVEFQVFVRLALPSLDSQVVTARTGLQTTRRCLDSFCCCPRWQLRSAVAEVSSVSLHPLMLLHSSDSRQKSPLPTRR